MRIFTYSLNSDTTHIISFISIDINFTRLPCGRNIQSFTFGNLDYSKHFLPSKGGQAPQLVISMFLRQLQMSVSGIPGSFLQRFRG